MTPSSAAATDAARRLWARAAGDASTPEEIALAAERMCTQLRLGLGRWVGADGYRALLDRALGVARAAHPALSGLSCLGGDDAPTRGAVGEHGADEVTAGLAGLVAVLIELLGRIIGAEMAVRLVEQMGRPSVGRVMSTETEGGRDG